MADRELTLPAFGPLLTDAARRLGVAGFWPWWTQQLNALVPARPRAAIERRRMRPVLVFDGDAATLWRPVMKEGQPQMGVAATIPLSGDAAAVTAAGRAALAPPASAPAGTGASPGPVKVFVSLPARDVLRRGITLPSAVEENLRQALSYDLDRHTPFKAEELYFDAVIVGRDAGKRELRVDLATARRAVVDSALKHAAAWGATVAAVVPEPPGTAAHSRLNLLPRDARAGHAFWRRWQFWLPVALLGLLAVAAVAIPLWQKRELVIALDALAGRARSEAAVSENLRSQLETQVANYNFALERKYAFPSAFRVIDEVSRLLPDDTWLTQFESKSLAKGKETQREMLVRGETANAGRLVQVFEESPLFAQTAPRSPTTKIQPGPGEIFDLGAQVKPVPVPARVALVEPKGAEAAAAPAAVTTPSTAGAPAPQTPAGTPVPGPSTAAAPATSTAGAPGTTGPANAAPATAPAVTGAPPPALSGSPASTPLAGPPPRTAPPTPAVTGGAPATASAPTPANSPIPGAPPTTAPPWMNVAPPAGAPAAGGSVAPAPPATGAAKS
jgi:general secretion pathway protein L